MAGGHHAELHAAVETEERVSLFIDGRRPGRARSRAVGTRFRTSRRVEAVREPVDEVVQTDRVDRFPHLFGSGIRSGEGHVVTDRPGKQEGFLRDDAELAAERAHRDVGEIVTVDCHPPRRRVVEAGDKLGQRRLTRPVAPTKATASPARMAMSTSLSTVSPEP